MILASEALPALPALGALATLPALHCQTSLTAIAHHL